MMGTLEVDRFVGLRQEKDVLLLILNHHDIRIGFCAYQDTIMEVPCTAMIVILSMLQL